MFHFHAGTGPDTQAIGIALEEMLLSYTLAPQKAPVPVMIFGQARLPDAANILLALARKTGQFLPPDVVTATPWLAKSPPGVGALATALAVQDYILGPYSIADMALYPHVAALPDLPAVVDAWRHRLSLRPGVGRGMGVVAG
jgi:glutathione S-transferase